MRMIAVMLGSLILVPLSVVPLSVAPLSAAWADDCTNATTQKTMNTCADEAYKKIDAELNAVYKQITDRLRNDEPAAKLLVTAQKAWVSFRDSECTFATAAAARGSMYPMLMAQCREGLTGKRVDELKAYLQCAEGDMACPVPPK